jgi:hypothetical protein
MNAIVRMLALSAKRRAKSVLVTSLGMLLLSQGCHAPAARNLAAPARLDERSAASLGSVEVESGEPAPAAVVDDPVATGKEVRKGAALVGRLGLGTAAGPLRSARIGFACGLFAPFCVSLDALVGAKVGSAGGLAKSGTNGMRDLR